MELSEERRNQIAYTVAKAVWLNEGTRLQPREANRKIGSVMQLPEISQTGITEDEMREFACHFIDLLTDASKQAIRKPQKK